MGGWGKFRKRGEKSQSGNGRILIKKCDLQFCAESKYIIKNRSGKGKYVKTSIFWSPFSILAAFWRRFSKQPIITAKN